MSFSDDYMKLRRKRLGALRSLDNDADIAPVVSNKAEEEEKERTWFNKGTLEDGYQFGDIIGGALTTTTDLLLGASQGALGLVEGLSDLLLYGVAGVGDLVGGDSFADDVKKIAKQNDVEKVFQGARNGAIADYSFLGDKGYGVAQGLGQVGAIIATGGLGAAGGLTSAGVTALTTGVMGASSFGSGMSEAYQSGASDGDAVAYGAMKGVVDAGTELIFGGLGKTVNAVGLSKGISSLDDVFAKKVSSKISSQFWSNAAEFGVKASAEGAEEVLAGIGSAAAKKLTYMSDEELNKLIEDEDLLDQFIMGAVTSGIAQSGIVPGMKGGSLREANQTGRDFITGLSANEQTVVDKVYEDMVAEAEKGGQELTNKQKNKIYDEVVETLKKGGISTDTIESVLGGDTYKSYKETVDGEDAIMQEYEELGKKQNATLAEQARYAELQAKVKEIKDNSPRSQLQAQLSEEVQKKLYRQNGKNIQTDDYLMESYNERARRGIAYEADLSQYDEKQAKVIDNAVKSGILNNTRRTHEFVDMIAKISADKGVSFDFTNNEKLKESGFAVDGKTINGFVTKDGITLNIQSAKSLNSVVGHEVAHVLEGTELYAELQNAVFEYAKARNDYDGRYADLESLYKDVEGADINAELTADLVGDYLFTDEKFIKSLSTKNRNVFQKIYDEVKYLYKIATAGSKEARELEKVKRAFDKAYKESGKASGDTKYSLTEVEAVQPKSDKWRRGATTDEVRQAHPTLYAVDETATEERNPTQVKGTVGSYRKVYESLKNEGFDGTILDASSGLGYGTQAGIEEYGFDVEDIEPYPDKDYKPKYTDYSSLDKKYDVVISNAVLNVLPQDQRDALVVKMGELLNDGGRMFINVRGKDVLNASGKIAINEANMEYFIPRTAKTGSYQKGFTKQELKAYLEDALGAGYTVEPTNMFGAVSAIVTKDGGTAKYSLSDSDGKKLTKEQSEYFKDSKMRDDNGNLKVMYHGSQDAGFHEFNAKFSDDDTSFFFVDRNDVAASYSGTTETYEAQTIRTADDMNNFIESIGVEGYEVVEKDGKFTLLYEGDRVADSKTAQGIYDEFCWYEGVGEGDANYKVYLNLTNPLEIDAKGRPWNKIDAEFSQEVYDKYNSLTAEEKAALTDLAEWEDFRIFNSEIQEATDNELASAYEKMGDDCNIYDLFSVAADSFSEESMRENARKYLKTRDYAQRAKEQGYDGVIFKNIIDNGGYSNGSEGASTVAIAFESNQIKSVANEKPTADADIRYSLSKDSNGRELSDEQREFFKDTKIKDKNGNLLVMYHGTKKGGFTVFQNKLHPNTEGFYFTNDKEYSDVFQGINAETGKYYDVIQEGIDGGYFSPETYEVYLDVKNPFVLTADQQEIIEDIGYWENIYKPIKDRGYDGVMMEDMSQVFVFNSNQIKSVTNTKPTGDPDIRYSLTEYTEAEKKAHNEAVKNHFGKTYSWKETGYLLLDGTKLDLSGKHDGAPGGYRTVDHRDITEALGYDYGGGDYSDSLVQFMSEGNIRIIPEIDGINLSVKPTKAQEQALTDYISRVRGAVVLDIDDLNGYTVVSVEYPSGTRSTKILNDIREWFDNGIKPENNLGYSLTKQGDAPKRYGRYNVYGKDLALETAPVAEAAPDNGTTSSEMEQVAPVQDTAASEPEDIAPTIEDEKAMFPNEPNMYDLEREYNAVYNQYRNALKNGDTKAAERLGARMDDLNQRLSRAEVDESIRQSESFASIGDADAPAEVEAPYYGETEEIPPDDPFENRDIETVGNRKVKAYMYENPEVKPFFQAEANVMLGELRDTIKGERFYTAAEGGVAGEYGAESYGVWTGTSRSTSADIEYLLDAAKMSYADIEKGLNAIIEDNGAENIAAAKKIEFVLNDRLLKGYEDFSIGVEVPPNQNYINLLNEKQIVEYSEEARKRFFDDIGATDIAPVAEQYETIKPKREPSNEPRLKRVKSTDETNPTSGTQIGMFDETADVLVSDNKSTKKKNDGMWSKFVTNFVDKGAIFEKLSLKTGNRALQEKYNHTLSSESRAQWLIGNGTEGVKSLKDIRAEVEETGLTKAFYEYMYHRHNVDRMNLEERYDDVKNKPVFGDSVTSEDSANKVKEYEQAHPEFKRYARDVETYMTHLRSLLVESGVISQDTADLWAEMYPHYVPIRREGDEGLNINVPLDTRRTGVNAPIKRATGGNRNIEDLFDTMAMRTEQTFRAIARNNFGVELKNTLQTEIDAEATNVDDVIDSIDAQDGLLQEGKNGKNPTFTVFENGKKVTFEISKEMYDALKPTSEGLKKTSKIANTATNWHRGVLTQYNPVFAATNAIKDAQDILINSQHAAKTYANIPRAIKELATKGKWFTEYMENGGEQNTYFDGQSRTFKEDKGWKKAIGMPLRAIAAANDFVERAPRLAEYIASREAGKTVEGAMLDAARVTTNFAAGGDVTKFLNRNGVTFLNASVQGFNQQVRNVREAKANGLKGWLGLATKVALAGLPAMLLNNLLWEDDEEYEELADYVKDNYYVVAKYGDGKFVRIPKGRTVAVIQDAFEQVSNAATGNDEVDFNNFFELFLTNLAPNNPLDNNILAPIMQVANNETWYGEDLVPTRLQDLPAAEQYDESTDSFSKWLGEKLDYSPYKINYLLNQYGGGISDVLLPMTTPEAESGDDSLLGNLLAPLKDKFTTDSVMNNQNVSDFYDTVDELTTNAKSSNATDEDLLKYKYMNSVNSELSELYKEKREVQNSDLSDSEKYETVREIQRKIDSITETSLQAYQDVYIDGDYALVGDRHFRLTDKGEWQKLSADQIEDMGDVTSGLGISPSTYWSNKSEYDFAYEKPEKYAVAKAIGGYESYKTYSSELYDIKADKDENGKSISGSRKEKVADYINNLDADYGEKIILFKSQYNADDTYNYEIIEYLNGRDDISYEEMVAILKELGFTVSADGNVTW